MNSTFDIQRLVQVSKMYYYQGFTQEKIAKEFRLSRSTVSMLLTEAKNSGIVKIQIKDPSVNNEELAHEFEMRFGLDKCLVIPINTDNDKLTLKIVASQAATFAAESMYSHSSVGISWGSACYEFMQTFSEDTNLCDICVVSLIGGSPLLSSEFQLNESVRTFAEKLCGIPVFIYAPGYVDSLQDKERFLESMYMKAITEKWNHLDFAVLGIGAPPELYDVNQNELHHLSMLEEINKHPDMAVGDFCSRRFNIKGEVLSCEHNNKLLGIDFDSLKNTKHIMAIAIGSTKIFSIIGALNTKILNCLVTDENTAKNVLNILDSKQLNILD
ncbi:MAG: sugar-binding domain-containing protein [Christensenellaceae bacterium]